MDQQNINSQNRDLVRADESIIAGQSEKIKKFFQALAVLVVFFSSLSMPLYLSYKAQGKAKQVRVKMEMGQLKNWGMIYQIENGSYNGLSNDPEIKKVFNDIKSMGGDAYIFISKDSKRYCCQANFLEKELGSWCVDHTGSLQSNGKCDASNIKCK